MGVETEGSAHSGGSHCLEALAGIYLGRIKRWDDPEIARANPRAKPGAGEITVVHRSDSSGTTYVWTDYLSKVSTEWKNSVGTGSSVKWPAGLGARGSGGVAGEVRQAPNSIDYVEAVYALQNKIPYGKVRNEAGNFVDAAPSNLTAAALDASKDIVDDFRVSITNARGKDAYPIATFSWLLIPEKIGDPEKRSAMRGFLSWMLTDGQKTTETMSLAPLPKAVVAKETKLIGKLQ